MLSVWVIPVFSFRVATATNITAFTRRPSARSRLAAVSASSTIRTLHTGFPSPSRAATRLCLSSPRCALYGWVLWRAGALSTTDKMSLALHAGLRFTSTDHYIGSIKCWQRWAPHTTPSHQYHNVFTPCVKICPLFNFFIDNLVKNQQFWTLIFGMHNHGEISWSHFEPVHHTWKNVTSVPCEVQNLIEVVLLLQKNCMVLK